MKRARKPELSRRTFLKATAAGALAFSAMPAIIVPRRVAAYEPGGRLHPNIDPLRVAGLQDPAMTTAEAIRSNWSRQEKLVARDVVQANMDALACALAEERAAADAWKAIFVKPPGKSRSDVVVGIKTNNFGLLHTHSAVMSKICHVLTGNLGVRGSNIHVYDACHGADLARKTPFTGLPEGVNLQNKWGGSNLETAIPVPYQDGQRKATCLGHLVTGEVDILVNIAVCKGHEAKFGGFTMCMKNHFGTFDPKLSHRGGGQQDYLFAINKAPEILGAMDPKTGSVLFPRQQLCIVDSLWAVAPNARSAATHQPNALFMGAFAPTVDFLVATRFRKGQMGWSLHPQVTGRFLSEFGIAEADLPNGGRIVDALS